MPAAGADVRPAVWRRVRPRHVVDLGQVVVLSGLLVVIEVMLRVTRAERVASMLGVRFLSVGDEPERPEPSTVTDAERRWVRNSQRLLRRWPWDATCLRRSLLIGWVLRRRDPVVVIGVRVVTGQVEAHAWLRVDGRDLDPTATQFATLQRPAPTR